MVVTTRRTRATANASPLKAGLPEKPKRRVKRKTPAPEEEVAPEPTQEEGPEEGPKEVSGDGDAPSHIDDDRKEAMELLRLADQKRKENLPLTKITVRPVEPLPAAMTPARAAPQTTPSTPRTNGNASPAATPQTESFFGRVFSSLKSSIFSTPKPARSPTNTNTTTAVSAAKPSTPLAEPVIGELTMTLQPSPTPVGQDRGSSKVRPSWHRKERAAIARNVVKSVQDPAEQERAKEWAERTLRQLFQGTTAATGEKRKRLEDGMTYGDLNHINSKPWKAAASSFGLDDELLDHVDDTPDQPAPMWAVLEHMRIEMQERKNGSAQDDASSPPAAKKQKTATSPDVTVRSLNQTPTPLDRTRSPFFNSGGRTTSLRDLHPRSCLDRGSSPENNNIFRRSQQQHASEQNSPPAPFPTSFSVPDDSDDDEDINDASADDTPTANRDATWTQSPPPAPVMTHAELPTSVGPTPSVPSVEGHLVSTPTVDRVDDRVEAQRAKVLKFTPHKPSNLSHMSKPSPSIRSDAGIESPTPPNFLSVTSGNAAPSVQTAGGTNGTSLFQNKTMSNGPSSFQTKSFGNGASPFQSDSPSNGASPLQTNSFGNGSSFQGNGLSNGRSSFPSSSISNGTPSFKTSAMTNGASPFQGKNTSSDDTELKIKGASKGFSDFKSAGTSLALPDFGSPPPDADHLDLPSDVQADLDAYAQSDELQAMLKTMNEAWGPLVLEFDDEL
ncbi:hypothetical protein BU23DRAFT_557224 [Bimuria novae-zelandiae CBS 107.79]|uniref:Uncharacterized protein n=1 Tax=Bimuria novae-zelandiae CBS 107.79 TaxID=1447943 RepID=A0A6A5UZ28_9PLEO|nr:hypothetical protein BU23DRAFT_557224 [Bimuria novae-zelandiae CBS 107.79]